MWVLKRMKTAQWQGALGVRRVGPTYLRMAELSLPAVITVVVNGLISTQDERVILTGKYRPKRFCGVRDSALSAPSTSIIV